MTSTTNRPRLADAGRGRPLRAVPHNAMAGDITALRAETQVAALAVTEWPAYGTVEWLQLDPRDPRCYAATLEAAELHRRAEAERARLDQLAEDDPEAWFGEVTAAANAAAARIAPALARRKTNAEQRAARDYRPAHRLRVTPGWPPIAIPGQPGKYLTPETTS
ncbi:hypothetical protein [Streptomyces cucumeris]|uniref:hypothetical protein n=1 Tax=Streptomyces cucumeris TaxID=2962890 RepID=UPI0020C8600F|nr:hypothetical protein [Streptomyces sp. NEAU-Y11]MCP9209957.1 hypothetical protein [Streptomyces sp. NEAU-Y11]